MWIIKGFFNGFVVLCLFGSGFYARHWLDPAFEAVEEFQEKREAVSTTATKLWPF